MDEAFLLPLWHAVHGRYCLGNCGLSLRKIHWAKQIVDSSVRDADATRKRIRGVGDGKSIDEARLALAKGILAFGQSLVQLEALDREFSDFSLEVVEQADKGPIMLARYAMKLAREVGNGRLTRAQIGNTLSVIEIAWHSR